LDPTPHWGYVFKGSFRVKYRDHEEVFNAGDVYYMEAGHTAIAEAGTEYLEISPAEQLGKTMAVIERNLAAVQR
jgi:quercetin dioxygenase-like cupin family protein